MDDVRGAVALASHLDTCWQPVSIQIGDIRVSLYHETGCSPSSQPTDPFQSPVAPTPFSVSLWRSVGLSLSSSLSVYFRLCLSLCLSPLRLALTRRRLFSLRTPRSIHQLGWFSLPLLCHAELSSIRLDARARATHVSMFGEFSTERRARREFWQSLLLLD